MKQSDQLNMTVFFWYLVRRDLSSVHVNSSVNWTSLFYMVQEKHGHVYLVTLYIGKITCNKWVYR